MVVDVIGLGGFVADCVGVLLVAVGSGSADDAVIRLVATVGCLGRLCGGRVSFA